MKQVVDHAVALRPAAAGIRSSFHAGRRASAAGVGPFALALSLAACAVPAFAQTAPEDQQADALEKVVVSSRNREEIAQDVPIPVTVIGGKTLERDNAVTVTDFTQKAPNLLVNAPNARQTSIAIRGLGKNSANDSMEASVGVIVDNVFVSHVGMSWADFADLDRIEIARGPQGTLLGKNTTLGVLNIVTKLPTWTPEYSIETSVSSRDGMGLKGTASGPIQEGVLAYRASVYAQKRDGILSNDSQSGETWLETNRLGGRMQFLLTPSSDVSARIIVDKSQANERINIDPYQVDPTTFADGTVRTTTYSTRMARDYFGGYKPIIGSRDRIDTNDARPLLTKQEGISAEVNWNINDFTLTSITAYRGLDFDAKNDGDQTPFSIVRNGTLLNTKGYTQELRLTSPVGGKIDYQVGMFALYSDASSTGRNLYGRDAGAFYASNAQYAALNGSAIGRQLMQDSLNGVFSPTETTPTTKSLAAFGQMNWHLTEKATLTLGLRDTYEDKDNSTNKSATGGRDLTAGNYAGATPAELAAAQAIRDGQMGSLYGYVDGQPIKQNSLSWLLNPSYKLNKNVLLYASTGYGEKSGAVQFDGSGNPLNVDPEKALDFELGFKSTLLDGRLLLNANVYRTEVKDYQAQLLLTDPTSSTGYRSGLSNVDKVQAQGLEFDGMYQATRNLLLNFGGSYNDATYKSFKNAICAPEANTSLPCDYSGRQLPNAPKVTFNAGLDYRVPIRSGLVARTFLNNTYRSSANYNVALSEYGKQDAYSLTDVGVSLGDQKGKYEFVLAVKNVFDKDYVTSIGSFNNSSAVGYTLGDGRLVSLTFRARL